MEPVALETDRLTLSVPTAADVDLIYDACQDPAIQHYTTVPAPYERHHAEGFITYADRRWADRAEATWAIRDGSSLAGMIGITGISAGGTGEIGYWMAPGARRRGLLTEAARAVVDWGFSTAGPALHRLEWRAMVGNVASARVAHRLGFRYEGTLRGALTNSFGHADGWVAGLLRDDDRAPQPWPVLED